MPSKFHQQLEPFLGQNLEMTVAADAGRVTITLMSQSDPVKTFLHEENTLAKTRQPDRLQTLQQH